ncbi:amidohydrolase family protein [Chelatococcus asaccharovorans]|uniref:amidohydrolase family protein n=1 Tax=Chelatococcus asaccharovorans TaxID=28210 RepID=UPI00224C78D7|nr:amidohydrolase family protein [Chelatococcus asaccharovorans]CAH1654102.1 L-fuconolactonase [Chelatococcus asaccharovorans]CAH1694505.1 L-fuconolactonase [Chelatococcus asaccharovorans]
MIIDSHCHVWENWPYEPGNPHAAGRGRADQLLYEMDAHGVDRAVIICAGIGDNPGNIDYAVSVANAYPGRFAVFPDIDCRWSADYHRPGAAARLEKACSRWNFKGFTHYLDEGDDGTWLASPGGLAFFGGAAARRLIVSLSALPHQMPAVIALAERLPDLPILIHHFAFLGPRTAATQNARELVLAAAACPNIHIKYSGLGNVAAPDQEYPYTPLAWILTDIAAAFGAARILWGSDFPVSRKHMTYKQCIALLTRHGPFAAADRPAVLGGNMARLLAASPAG